MLHCESVYYIVTTKIKGLISIALNIYVGVGQQIHAYLRSVTSWLWNMLTHAEVWGSQAQ